MLINTGSISCTTHAQTVPIISSYSIYLPFISRHEYERNKYSKRKIYSLVPSYTKKNKAIIYVMYKTLLLSITYQSMHTNYTSDNFLTTIL